MPTMTLATQREECSLSGLEQRLSEIDHELDHLAHYSLRSGVGAIGYRSEPHDTAANPEWIQINLGAEVAIDTVVLVPALWRDTEKGFRSDGFPLKLRILAGSADHPDGRVVAEYNTADEIDPGLAPLVIPTLGATASWIRVEATYLSLRAFDGRYIFQLSEILVFSGSENLALRKPIQTSSNSDSIAWNEQFAVDGFMPYLMDSAQGNQSIAYVSPSGIDDHSSLTIDLGRKLPLSRVHLHTVDQSDTIPQSYAGDFGIPTRMLIEGANQPDFSDAIVLLDIHHETSYDSGPIMMWRFPETACRYVRLNVVEPFLRAGRSQIGFAEIELFSNGRNMAKGKPFRSNFPKPNDPVRFLTALTDGNNLYGEILPVRDWLSQLALRHTLEMERPLVAEKLSRHYARQKANLNRMGWLTALLAAGTVCTILIDRMIRQHVVFKTRERIAADLHDELGANLHAIGLLSDLAQQAKGSPEKLTMLLQRMRALTARTGAAARYCSNLLEAKGLYEDIVEDMRRTSARIMADLEHTITFEGEEFLQRLKPRKRIDLFLFYKECLINIIRHSGATKASTQLIARNKALNLIITDNGHGLKGEVPASLKRRARLLGAHVETDHPAQGGTRITLTLKTKKLGVRK